MSWDVTIERIELIHDCPNCGGHEQESDFEKNITYNVGNMLRRAGIHPKVLNGMRAFDALPIVRNGYCIMRDNPDYFRQFRPDNGWGTVKSTLDALRDILDVLEVSHPDDKVRWQ